MYLLNENEIDLTSDCLKGLYYEIEDKNNLTNMFTQLA